MGLDLATLVGCQAAAPDRQREQVLVRDEVIAAAVQFGKLDVADDVEMTVIPLSEHVGSVGARDGREIIIDPRDRETQILLDATPRRLEFRGLRVQNVELALDAPRDAAAPCVTRSDTE